MAAASCGSNPAIVMDVENMGRVSRLTDPRAVAERLILAKSGARERRSRTPRSALVLDEALDHARPGASNVAPVVAAAAKPEHAAIAEPVGEPGEACRSVRVRLLREAQVRDRDAFQTVGAALEQDELRAA